MLCAIDLHRECYWNNSFIFFLNRRERKQIMLPKAAGGKQTDAAWIYGNFCKLPNWCCHCWISEFGGEHFTQLGVEKNIPPWLMNWIQMHCPLVAGCRFQIIALSWIWVETLGLHGSSSCDWLNGRESIPNFLNRIKNHKCINFKMHACAQLYVLATKTHNFQWFNTWNLADSNAHIYTCFCKQQHIICVTEGSNLMQNWLHGEKNHPIHAVYVFFFFLHFPTHTQIKLMMHTKDFMLMFSWLNKIGSRKTNKKKKTRVPPSLQSFKRLFADLVFDEMRRNALFLYPCLTPYWILLTWWQGDKDYMTRVTECWRERQRGVNKRE